MVHKIKSIWSYEPNWRIRNNRMMSKAFEIQNVNKNFYVIHLVYELLCFINKEKISLCNLQKSSIMRIILVWAKINLLKIFACKTLQNSTRIQEKCKILYEFFLKNLVCNGAFRFLKLKILIYFGLIDINWFFLLLFWL